MGSWQVAAMFVEFVESVASERRLSVTDLDEVMKGLWQPELVVFECPGVEDVEFLMEVCPNYRSHRLQHAARCCSKRSSTKLGWT